MDWAGERARRGSARTSKADYSPLNQNPVDENDLRQSLTELDAELRSPIQILIVGGAAMILAHSAPRATRDVDAILIQGDPIELRRAVKAVAEPNGLPADWLSDAVMGFAAILPADYPERARRLDLAGEHLRVSVLPVGDQVAMKVVALREQDLEDLDLLLPQMTDEDRAAVFAAMERVAGIRPDWALRIQYFTEEQGWKKP